MRIAVSATAAAVVMVLGLVSPAMAADAPVPFGGTAMSMHDAVANGPLIEARFGDDDKVQFQQFRALVGDQFTADAPFRHRLGSKMMEYYPVANSGFHLSTGVHYFNTTNFSREAEKLSPVLWSPSNRGFGSIRTGFKRKTPAMTAGYTQTVANKLAFGLEAGTLFGRVNSNMPHFGQNFSESGMSMRLNPVAAFTMAMKF